MKRNNMKKVIHYTNTKDEGIFPCARECGKAYPYYSSLKKHIKIKHKGIPPSGAFKPKTVGR